jgi:glycosyltransferase involved in cell wall biosynthesis
MRLDLGAANAIQTYNTVRELSEMLPGLRLVVPRWLREPSAFEELGALHLPRPAVNKASRLVPWAGWSYIERSLYAWMLVVLLLVWRVVGRGYEVLYVRDAVCAAWLVVLRTVHGVRVIYEVHDLESAHPSKANRWPRWLWAWLLRRLDRAALGGADRLVSLTETFKRWVVRRGIRREMDIAVIPDAFDPVQYRSRDKGEARVEAGFPQEAFIVGYGGLTFAYRRLDLLVEAFAEMAKGRADALLVLVGGRPGEVEEMRRLAERLGVGDSLVMPGQVSPEENAVYMAAADVLAIPDTVTGMTASPLKLFEYMAVGRAIVLKDMPALREIVDEESALFFPAGNREALARAMVRLYEDRELARRLGEAAREKSEGYTYRARAEKIVEVVEGCL